MLEEGTFDHENKMPEVLPPEKRSAEELSKHPIFAEMPAMVRRYYQFDRPVELQPVELDRNVGRRVNDGGNHIWMSRHEAA